MELEYRFSDEFLIFLSVFAYLSSPLTIKNRVKMKIRITRGKIILRKTRETQTRTRTTGQIGQRAIPGDRSVVELFGTAETSKTCSGTPEIERDGQMEKRNKQNRGKRNSSREGNKNPLAESHVIHKPKITQSDKFLDRTKAYCMGPVLEQDPQNCYECKIQEKLYGFCGQEVLSLDYGLWKDFIGVLVPRELGTWYCRASSIIKSLLEEWKPSPCEFSLQMITTSSVED
jgi:hypothetical protein